MCACSLFGSSESSYLRHTLRTRGLNVIWWHPRRPSSSHIRCAHHRCSLFAGLPTSLLKVPCNYRGPYTGSARRGLRRRGDLLGPLACSCSTFHGFGSASTHWGYANLSLLLTPWPILWTNRYPFLLWSSARSGRVRSAGGRF